MIQAFQNSAIFSCLALAPLAASCDAGEASETLTTKISSSQSALGEIVSEVGSNVWVIYQDKKGSYWFGSDGRGVFRYDGKQIIRYSTRDGLPNDRIREIKEDKAGNIFISTLEGISKFDGQKFTRLKVVEDDSAWRLHPDDLWFKGGSDTSGPYRYDGTTLYLLKFPKHYLEDQTNREFPRQVVSPYSVFNIYQDTKGHLWFGTQHLGACRYDGKTLTWIYERHLSEAENGGTFGIRSIAEDRSGKFWICSNRFRYIMSPGLSQEQNQKINYIREPGVSHIKGVSEYKPIFFESMIRDAQGNLWMSSNGSGVWRFDGNEMKHFPVKTGDSWLISVYEDRSGAIMLATDSAGMFRYDGKDFAPFTPKSQG